MSENYNAVYKYGGIALIIIVAIYAIYVAIYYGFDPSPISTLKDGSIIRLKNLTTNNYLTACRNTTGDYIATANGNVNDPNAVWVVAATPMYGNPSKILYAFKNNVTNTYLCFWGGDGPYHGNPNVLQLHTSTTIDITDDNVASYIPSTYNYDINACWYDLVWNANNVVPSLGIVLLTSKNPTVSVGVTQQNIAPDCSDMVIPDASQFDNIQWEFEILTTTLS